MKKLKNKDDMRCKERPALNICKMYRAPRARSLCPLAFVLGRFAKNAVLELHEPQQSRMLRGYLQYKILPISRQTSQPLLATTRKQESDGSWHDC
jgi:hypothetical protein